MVRGQIGFETRLLLLLVMLLAAVTVRTAWAHTELVRADPAAGSTVAGEVARIEIEFNEAIGAGSTLTIYAGTFAAVTGVEIGVAGPLLTASLAEPLATGTYTVEWVVIGEDGHSVQGSYQFAVGPGQARNPPGLLLWGIGAAAVVAGLAGLALAVKRSRRSGR